MNSTTSLPLTSLSIHCSMLISRPFAKLFVRGAAASRPSWYICSAGAPRSPRPLGLFLGCVKRPLHLANVILIEAVDLDDGARRIGPLPPQLLLHLVDQRAEAEHVGDVDHEANRVA